MSAEAQLFAKRTKTVQQRPPLGSSADELISGCQMHTSSVLSHTIVCTFLAFDDVLSQFAATRRRQDGAGDLAEDTTVEPAAPAPPSPPLPPPSDTPPLELSSDESSPTSPAKPEEDPAKPLQFEWVEVEGGSKFLRRKSWSQQSSTPEEQAETADALFQALDTNDDGVIDKAEWEGWHREMQEIRSSARGLAARGLTASDRGASTQLRKDVEALADSVILFY